MSGKEVHDWRRSTSDWPVWHLMREDGKAVCGRTPKGAWKSTSDSLMPWPENSCMSCMDVWCKNFPPRRDEVAA
jgi:hypothetical protein